MEYTDLHDNIRKIEYKERAEGVLKQIKKIEKNLIEQKIQILMK